MGEDEWKECWLARPIDDSDRDRKCKKGTWTWRHVSQCDICHVVVVCHSHMTVTAREDRCQPTQDKMAAELRFCSSPLWHQTSTTVRHLPNRRPRLHQKYFINSNPLKARNGSISQCPRLCPRVFARCVSPTTERSEQRCRDNDRQRFEHRGVHNQPPHCQQTEADTQCGLRIWWWPFRKSRKSPCVNWLGPSVTYCPRRRLPSIKPQPVDIWCSGFYCGAKAWLRSLLKETGSMEILSAWSLLCLVYASTYKDFHHFSTSLPNIWIFKSTLSLFRFQFVRICSYVLVSYWFSEASLRNWQVLL